MNLLSNSWWINTTEDHIHRSLLEVINVQVVRLCIDGHCWNCMIPYTSGTWRLSYGLCSSWFDEQQLCADTQYFSSSLEALPQFLLHICTHQRTLLTHILNTSYRSGSLSPQNQQQVDRSKHQAEGNTFYIYLLLSWVPFPFICSSLYLVPSSQFRPFSRSCRASLAFSNRFSTFM